MGSALGNQLITDTWAGMTGGPTNAGSGTGTISIGTEKMKDIETHYSQQPLFFQIQWSETATGRSNLARDVVDEFSYSPFWGLAIDDTVATQMHSAYPSAFNPSDAAFTQGTSAIWASSTQTIATGTPTFTTSASTTSTSPDSTTSSSSKSTSNPIASSKPAALSTGALAGIIIGSVAALAFVLILAFLCIRKRRQNSRKNSDHDRDTQDLMAEKEARAVGTAPDTPYSEEGSQRLNRGRGLSGLDESSVNTPRGGGMPGGEASQRGSVVYSSLRNVTTVGTGAGSGHVLGESPTDTHPSSSISLHEQPYADLPAQEQQFHRTTSHTAAAANPVRADNDVETEQSPLSPAGAVDEVPPLGPTRLGRADTPGGMSISDYLHEDGMTADEIRRLEDEERALDEAIERAGRTEGRAGGGR